MEKKQISLKKILTVKISLIFLGFILGGLWYRYDLPPRPILRKIFKSKNNYLTKSNWPNLYEKAQLTYSRYKKGVPIFLDRPYVDSIGDDRLENLYLIQIKRHEKNYIRIKTDSPLTIYRLVPKGKSGLRNNYQETGIKVKVKGISTNHIYVLKKKFKPGIILLSPGGPTASAPILFSSFLDKVPLITIDKVYSLP